MTVGVTAAPAARRRGTVARSLSLVFADPVYGAGALLIVALLIISVLHSGQSAFDFRHAYWSAGNRVLHGRSPYVWTPEQFRLSLAFVYPAASALLFAPLALLSVGVGSVLFMFACICLVPATLWILGVRDRRLYGVALLWMPVFGAWETANETLFLVFGTACVWRFRDRPVVAAVVIAVMISLKPLMWPLAIWLLATRRWRASAYALVCGLSINAIAWSVIGFGQIGPYLRAASTDLRVSWRAGYGVEALASHLGFGRDLGDALLWAASAILLGVLLFVAFLWHRDLQALIVAIALALASSPLIWSHYLSLLLVPMALLRPRLHWLWALPVAMWLCPPPASVHGWQAGLLWSASVLMFLTLGRRAAGHVGPALADPVVRTEMA